MLMLANNAKVYFERAIGKSQEMEVSKAMANILKSKILSNNKILDVGCACGHFYRSIKKRVKKNFYYTGTDPYSIFLEKAKKAWKKDQNVNFVKGNIYNLPFKKDEFDISFCSNLFIHLNDVKKPLKELFRVSCNISNIVSICSLVIINGGHKTIEGPRGLHINPFSID